MVVTASGGSIMLKNEDEAWELFENMSETFQHYASTFQLERAAASTLKNLEGCLKFNPLMNLPLEWLP